VRGTEAWDDAMVKARGQAERYVRALPASEPNPPFLLVVDVGHSFEVFADFTQAGKATQSHIQATYKPSAWEGIGTPKPPYCDLKATYMRPSSHSQRGLK
jgi:hypothetical protein